MSRYTLCLRNLLPFSCKWLQLQVAIGGSGNNTTPECSPSRHAPVTPPPLEGTVAGLLAVSEASDDGRHRTRAIPWKTTLTSNRADMARGMRGVKREAWRPHRRWSPASTTKELPGSSRFAQPCSRPPTKVCYIATSLPHSLTYSPLSPSLTLDTLYR